MKKHYQNKLVLSLIFSVVFFTKTNAQQIFTECTVKNLASKEKPTVIMIYGDYCGACKKAKDDLPEIIKRFKNKVDFFMCNVQDTFTMRHLKKHKIATQPINSIPLFIIRNKAKHRHTEVGYPGQKELISKIKSHSK